MENKFAHLLQPIRDLAANWDVNVAEELEDYLEDLESIHFELEQENEPGGLNFAEAALVIQGSASVYGRKVEYLHNLVYAALDAIANKRTHVDRPNDAEDADEGSEIDIEEKFLTLDDVPEGGNEIDLQDQTMAPPPSTVRPPTSLYLLGNCEGPMSLSKLQTYADSSGAIMLDPTESLESSATVVHCANGLQDTLQSHPCVDADNEHFDSDCGYEAQEQCYDSPGSHAQADQPYKENAPPFDDEIDDPFEPLEHDRPGPLAEKPFKLRMPTKRSSVKAKENADRPRLIRTAGLNSVAFEEFEIYLKRNQEINAQQRRKENPAYPLTPSLEEEAGQFAGEQAGYDDDDEGAYGGANDDELPCAYSPIIGAAYPRIDEADLQAVTSYQDQAMREWHRHQDPVIAGQLEERVKRWQQSIKPHLEAQESHPAFDIGACGMTILEVMRSEAEQHDWTDFGAVANRKDAWEIPRIFASMLQLVNAGSILICKT